MNKDTMMEMGFPFTEVPEEEKKEEKIEYAEDGLTGTLEIMPQ
jgi:hypothetical protein